MLMSGPGLMVVFILAIMMIIFFAAKVKLHAFLTLLIATFFIGLAAGLPPSVLIGSATKGFGEILGHIGILVVCGFIIGEFLTKSGAGSRIADFVFKKVRKRLITGSISLTGYVVTIFTLCYTTSYTLLSPTTKEISTKTRKHPAFLGVTLSLGCIASFHFVPPCPGVLGAIGPLGVDLGKMIPLGLLASMPALLAGFLWGKLYCSRLEVDGKQGVTVENLHGGVDRSNELEEVPKTSKAFLPILLPITFICLRSLFNATLENGSVVRLVWDFLGNPTVALLMGVCISLSLPSRLTKEVLTGWIGEGIKTGSETTLIIGAGGAFGKIIATAGIGDYMSEVIMKLGIPGIFVPFLIAATLKTAQGSAIVSMVTTSAIVAPMVSSLAIAPEMAVLAVGAGAIIMSHAPDAWFWMVMGFSDMDVSTCYKTQTVGTIVVGLAAMSWVTVLSFVFY
jgi:GntP family gluconate:H+ symporter